MGPKISDRDLYARNSTSSPVKELVLVMSSYQPEQLLLEPGLPLNRLETFDEIKASAQLCPMYVLIVSVVVDPFSFSPDDSRPISRRATSSGKTIEISFSRKEDAYEEMISKS